MVRYIADLHFDDADIIAYDNRPFNSVEEMNEAMLSRWNRVTGPEDTTYIVGDFCGSSADRWIWFLQRLRGKKVLITGNHDAAAREEGVASLLEGVCAYLEILDEGRNVVLCHYPIVCFHNHYFGWYHLYGHVHQGFEESITQNSVRLLRKLYVRDDICQMLNIGAMLPFMDYTPRSLDELEGHF